MKTKLTPAQIHDAKYYYSVFAAIPEELWWQGSLVYRPGCQYQINGVFINEMRCALGHLANLNLNSDNLETIFQDFDRSSIVTVNDSFGNPKNNILNKLKQILNSQ